MAMVDAVATPTLHPPPHVCTHTHPHARTVSYGLQFTLDTTRVCENNWDVAMILKPTVIMTHAFRSLPFGCVNKPDNKLGDDGATALVPALTQMTQMTTLNLSCKSRMTHAHRVLYPG